MDQLFILLGYDGRDAQALERRMNARDAHIAYSNELKAQGTLLFAAAMLDSEGRMAGSTCIYQVRDRAHLEAILEQEPYVLGNVWDNVDITPIQVSPTFEEDL